MSEEDDSFSKSALILCILLVAFGMFMRDMLGILFICVGAYLMPSVLFEFLSKK